MKFLVCFFVALAAVPSLAQVVRFGKCPKVAAQSTFNATAYLGSWYEIERFPAVFEGDRCVQAVYSLRDDGKINVNNSYVDDDGQLKVAIGEAYVPDSKEPAVLSVSFGSNPFSKGGEYRVVATDYKTYTLVTSCGFDLGIFHVEFAWILARQRTLSPDTINMLKAKIGGDDGFKVSKFQKTDQAGC